MYDNRTPKTIAEIISSTMAQLIAKGYNDDYRRTMVAIFDVFSAYCSERTETLYSALLVFNRVN